MCIEYRGGYKYQLAKTYVFDTEMILGYTISSRYIQLNEHGILTIYQGYCWDGPSGPTVDTPNFMRGSLVHDALYQLIREGHLPMDERYWADRLLKKICLEDGMSRVRAWYVFHSVDKFAASAAMSKNKKKIIKAP